MTRDWIITAAGCGPKWSERLEDEGFAVLNRPAAIERRSDGVRLRNERGSIDLRPLMPVSLAGTSWRVLNVNGQPPPTAGIIRFDERTLNAFFRCNHGTHPTGRRVISCVHLLSLGPKEAALSSRRLRFP